MTPSTATRLALAFASFGHAAACQMLMAAGLSLNDAARTLFNALRAVRGAAC